ncbi:hypothetical protein HMSSN036_92950 [Paenibacillus macerans]|nr:hypothetical protein HMSSN036_92950 [Paenibacillus macerans]
MAAAAEFIHAASLIHDDIIDDSPVRRGQKAMHIKLGVSGALHVGNYMSARVIELISVYSADRDKYAYNLSSLATTQLCLGEYQQLAHLYDYGVTIEQYLEKSKNKTAQLMATCLQTGAQASGADSETAELLYAFGEKLGMSFQIRDDVLDFTQSAEQLGKPAGSDLRSGQITLPVLLRCRTNGSPPHPGDHGGKPSRRSRSCRRGHPGERRAGANRTPEQPLLRRGTGNHRPPGPLPGASRSPGLARLFWRPGSIGSRRLVMKTA